ncbi:hypothetical protein M3Y99_00286900 [Aphelenchoides fujianensis]|nr:hypothetical protein M3Y99_00286900 [Aphelenchoides fujianensis]
MMGESSGHAAGESLDFRLFVEPPTGVVDEPNEADSSLSKQPLKASTAIVLETKDLDPRVACSADGRHAFFLVPYDYELVIVDLVEKTHKILRSARRWPLPDDIEEFAVVDANTLLVYAGSRHVTNPSSELRLVRFGDDAAEYEVVDLRPDGYFTFCTPALTIHGQRAEVKQAVFGKGGKIRFFRLDVDEPRLVREGKCTRFREDSFRAHFTEDGKKLLVLRKENPLHLHVWSIEEKLPTFELIEEGDLNSELSVKDFFWSSMVVYATAEKKSSGNSRLFRCRLDRKKWERLPIEGESIDRVCPIVSPADGEDEGIVVFTGYWRWPSKIDKSLYRTKVERFMFRDPKDRKEKAETPEQSPVPPHQYGGMTPIAVGRLE